MASITKRDIVDEAFELLGMSGYNLDDSPEDSQSVLLSLDNMMAGMQTGSYDFGYMLADDIQDSYLGDIAGIKRDALSGISHKLALRICNKFGKQPSLLLYKEADDAYNEMLTIYQKIPDIRNCPDNVVLGTGNKVRWW